MRQGDRDAGSLAMQSVYAELHRLAGRFMRRESQGHTLQPTALVNEAYLRLAQGEAADPKDRQHFVAIAATVMRRILVDHARRRMAGKRVAPAIHTFDLAEAASADERAVTVIALEDALARLADACRSVHDQAGRERPQRLTEEETAAILGVTARTVHRDWLKARSWLQLSLEGA